MVFTDDTAYALRSAAALVNTLPGTGPGGDRPDRLTTLDQLETFVRDWRWSGGYPHDEATLAAVRALRPHLREFWGGDEQRVVDRVNLLLEQTHAVPQLVDHDGWGWHLHATPAQAPLATRMAGEAAMALVDVVRAGELGRLRVCAAPDCEYLVVDLSKNRSRRYCEGGCGNRAAVAAYRARRRER